jgi:O-antigen ligase
MARARRIERHGEHSPASTPALPAPLRWLLWLAVLLPPLVFLPTASDPFRLPKLLAAETLGLASLLGLALVGRLRPTSFARPLPPALIAVAPFVALATLSLAWSDYAAATRRALADLWIGAACLVGWSVALRGGELRRLLAALAWPAAALALLAALQWHDVWHPIAFVQGIEGERTQSSNLAGNAADLAGFLVVPLVLLQARLGGRWDGGRKGWTLALLLLIGYGLVLSQTLVALAAAFAASALLWALVAPTRRALLALALIAMLTAGLVAAVPALRDRLAEKWGFVGAGNWNALLSNRPDGWAAARWMMAGAPLVGTGFGTFASHFAAAKLDLVASGRKFGVAQFHHFANAHNDYLEVAAELGALGIAALGFGLWRLGRAIRARPAPERAPAWAATAAVAVLALGQFPFETAITAYPAVVLFAWIFTPVAAA